ncbi:hypothetical protein ZIOFF_075177 [Zingiber officinale]|uniref:Nuclear-pore anchor n=1 Tax=Zingiber officinale TaxID=94328 RepID=A0A8J5EL20_ZINOF|nr:hypothetical protein ZIOFF_075177 [Zingiber officinale]
MLTFDWDGTTFIEELDQGGRCPRLRWMFTMVGFLCLFLLMEVAKASLADDGRGITLQKLLNCNGEEDIGCGRDEVCCEESRSVRKLAELYKERSEEWSKKSGELEGVIKALETHLCQVENEYKDKLEKESSQRKNLEKDAADMKGTIEKYEAELENARKSSEISLVPVANFHSDSSLNDLTVAETTNNENNQILVPKIPLGVSGTALAASLLRDGWSLAKMYEKYQEAADALRHEKWGRKNAEAVLARVLHEIEEKAELILDERDEHARMIEAYNLMNKKLLQSLEKHENFENTIMHLKAESRKWECEYTIAQKEISDLEKQVTLLLKECQEIQVRCGVTQLCNNNPLASAVNIDEGRSTSEHLISFKDINELVEQNVQLRGHVARLSTEMENKETELMDAFQIQLQKITAEAASKVEAMLKRSEEQGQMIESLHSSVAMYRRLYEEEQKISASTHPNTGDLAGDRKNELMLMFEGSQDVSKKAYDRLAERSKGHEEDLAKFRGEVTLLRSERDKKVLEANFAKDQVDGLKKEIEHQHLQNCSAPSLVMSIFCDAFLFHNHSKVDPLISVFLVKPVQVAGFTSAKRKEANAVSARNVELTQLVVDFQKRLRESSNSVQEAEEIIRKLSMEVSILKHEKEILTNSERRATDEIHNLSERVHRLQSTLDTIQSADEVRESSRTVEIKKLEEYAKRVEREWAEANRELQEERDRVRVLTNDKDNALETSIKQLQEMKKELTDAWATVTSAESRSAVAEARCSEIETRVMSGEQKDGKGDARYDHPMFSTNEDSGELWRVREELERLREESQANKDYMVQYKEIAHTNEMALKQIESAHEAYKLEAEKVKRALADDVSALRNKVSEMEKKYILKCEEVASLIEAKDREISALFAETSSLRVEISQKLAQIESLETQVSSLKEDLDGEHKQWQIAQHNYERQVMLQSETIQELTKTSHELSSLQCEVVKLREVSDMLKNEKEILKSSWENEKTTLHAMKDESDKKYNEVNEQASWCKGTGAQLGSEWKTIHRKDIGVSLLLIGIPISLVVDVLCCSHVDELFVLLMEILMCSWCQPCAMNKILHSQLESLYARFGEKGHNSAGIVSQTVDSKAESDLHTVISYLRRSKEIAETEIILLKQEKLRHQTQVNLGPTVMTAALNCNVSSATTSSSSPLQRQRLLLCSASVFSSAAIMPLSPSNRLSHSQTPVDSSFALNIGHKLDGHNYLQWSKSMMMFVIDCGRDDYLTGAAVEPVVGDPNIRNWKTKNNLVMSWLICSMITEIGENFLLYSSVKEIWDAARETFSISDNTIELFHVESTLQDLHQVDPFFFTLARLGQKLDHFESHEWKCTDDAAYFKKIIETKQKNSHLLLLENSLKILLHKEDDHDVNIARNHERLAGICTASQQSGSLRETAEGSQGTDHFAFHVTNQHPSSSWIVYSGVSDHMTAQQSPARHIAVLEEYRALMLETALKASETAKELLQSKRENDRALLLKDEELKALLIQLREINLLRESNVQLREENKHNFEEFQRYLNEAQKARVDAEKFENLLREKQLQYDASQKEVDVLRTQIDHLNIRISELAECYKNIDLVEYEKMKDEREKLKASFFFFFVYVATFALINLLDDSFKVFLRKSETEIELTKKLLSEKQETIANLDQSLAKCQLDLAEQEKRVNNAVQAQGTIKLENEKQKKIMSVLKKRNDNLMKEKEELNQEKMVLLKEIDDFKSGQKTSVETSIKQATKEKDTRIQILERTLERERDENKKQKQKRESTEKTIFELIQKISKEKKALSEEFLRHKLAAEALKSSGGTTSQLPSETTLSEQFDRYIQATVQLETAPGSIADVGPTAATDTVSVDASIATAGRRVATQPTRPLIPQVKPTVEKEKDSAVVQPTSSARRIVGRRIVRPRLARPPEEPQADGGTSGVEGSSLTEDEKTGTSHEHESSGDNLFGHPASSGCKNIASTSNENEDVAPRDLGADAGAPLKEMDSDEMYGPTSSAQVAPTDRKHPALKTLQKDLVDATRDELGADVVPPLKKSKYTDGLQDLTQDISNEQAVLPSAVDVETTEASFPSVLHPTSEEIEVDQVMEEILDSMAEESFASDQQNPSLDESAVTEDFPDKPKETCELLDESLRSKAVNEITEIPADEDDREEGELPDEMVTLLFFDGVEPFDSAGASLLPFDMLM